MKFQKTVIGAFLFCCATLGFACTAGATYYLTGGTAPAKAPAAGEPYGDYLIGTFTWSTTDMQIPGSMPITVVRTYRTEYKNSSGSFISGAFGPGMNLNYAMFLYSPSEVAGGSNPYSNAEVIAPNGAATFCTATGSTTNYTQASFLCDSNPGPCMAPPSSTMRTSRVGT